MVWKRKQRSLLLNNEQNKDYQILLGFLVVSCVFWLLVFVFFFSWRRIGGVSEILSISTNHFLLWLAAVLCFRWLAQQYSLRNNCLQRTDESEVMVKGECTPINYCIIIYQEYFCSLSLKQLLSGILHPTFENGPNSAKYLSMGLKAEHWLQQLS